MALIKWRPARDLDPLDLLTGFRSELDQLVEKTLSPFRGGRTGLFEGAWVPVVDVFEDDDRVVVRVDLPGIDKKDIDVSIQGDTLIVKGEKKQEEEVKEKDYHRLERAYGSFQRVIQLPAKVDAQEIKAACRDGVLEISLPKKEEVKARKIEIGE